jgi:putative ABC transport system permease protein
VVIGLLASIIGLALGFGVGAALAALFTAFAGGGGLSLSLGLPAAAVISAFAVGIGITVIAALIPAIRAARIPPVAALREVAAADRPLTRLTITGGAVFVVGAVLLTLGLTGTGGNTLLFILGGVLLTFVGTALLTPLFARPVAGLIGRLFAWSVPGQLGRLNAGRNPRRTAITAAALMVGIALITGINTVITSAKASITQVANSQAHVDLLISGDQGATFDPAVLNQAAQVHGVQGVSGLYEDAATVNGELTFVGAFSNMAVVPSMFTLSPSAGSISTVDNGQVVVDQPTATDKHLHVGSPVTVQLARGNPVQLTVSGIYNKSDLLSGFIVPVSLVNNFHIPSPTLAFIQVKPGASVDSVKASVNQLVADNPEVSVGDRAQYLNQQTSQVNTVLVMIQILLALAILIAVLGVINTLALSVIERTREIGLLRAVGLRRAQTMRMITVEAVVISVFGAVLGLAVGLGLGAAVVRALHDQGISQFAVPWGQLITYLILAAIVGVVAAVLPAIRAARVNVLQAIAYE